MRMLVTLAVVLGLVGLTAQVGSAQNIILDKINLKPAPAMAPPGTPPTVQPEGLVFEQPGLLEDKFWKVTVTFGKIKPNGDLDKFMGSPVIDVTVAVPTPMNGLRWRVAGAFGVDPAWAANGIYYCQADLRSSPFPPGPLEVWRSRKAVQMEVK